MNTYIPIYEVLDVLGISIKNLSQHLTHKDDFYMNDDDEIFINFKTIVKKVINGKTKRYVSTLTKKYIAAQQEWKCNQCQNVLDAMYEVDHIVALMNGGSNSHDNLQALCRCCHGNKTLQDHVINDDEIEVRSKYF